MSPEQILAGALTLAALVVAGAIISQEVREWRKKGSTDE